MMGTVTGIAWCHHTFNPWYGCTAVGPGCDHCYARALVNGRMAGDFDQRVRTAPSTWRQPLAWNRAAERDGIRRRVFCASLADVFDNQVPPDWRGDLFDLIQATPHLDWLLLTKRVGNAAGMLPNDWGHGWPNVWLGATVVTQNEADRDAPKLLHTSAAVRFLSCEPLLRPIDLKRGFDGFLHRSIDWVIVGGESGPGARPMHPNWARSLRDQCAAAGVPFFFKQWGAWAPAADDDYAVYVNFFNGRVRPVGQGVWATDARVHRIGKRAAGNLLDGRKHEEFAAPLASCDGCGE